ncbi:MAG TPA: hypothetical protein VLO30_10190 [Chthoniobacterales bacterium]|nr:hypothetical protein [Chthoniobacterales bacterium]
MRKVQLLILASAIAAGAIWWTFYRTHHTSSLAVASLLPKDTLALVHLPDFNRSRNEWHKTDLYQLWKEPAVQDFLAKPRSKVPTEGRIGQTVEDISALEMKDAFFAVISIEASAWKWNGGFRYTGDAEKAAKVVDGWKARAFGSGAETKRETVEFQGRQILTESAGLIRLSTAWAGPWFFFANDIEHLKPLLDRADGRVKDANTALSSDDVFVAASKHMPASYAALAYSRLDQFIEKLMPAGEQSQASPDRLAMLRQVRSFCAATVFDGGRMRDTVFVGMPRVADLGNLTRASLPIANKDTFLYAASVLDLRKEMDAGWQTPGLGWLGGLQKMLGSLSANGITLEEWKSAFGSEVGLIGTWGTNSQWPSLVAAMPVKDSAKANRIVTTITDAKADAVQWTHREKEGVHYYSGGSGPQLFSFSPTIGLSDRMLVAGADAASAEAAMQRSSGGASELAATRNFQNAERSVPTAQQAFVYLDPSLVYARFDASLRPLLAMGAAFLPAVSDTVDLGRLPPADIIAKHLGPIVMSQSYRGDGYVAESVGSVPFYQTVLGAVTAGTAAAAVYRQQTQGPISFPTSRPITPSSLSVPSHSPSPEASP